MTETEIRAALPHLYVPHLVARPPVCLTWRTDLTSYLGPNGLTHDRAAATRFATWRDAVNAIRRLADAGGGFDPYLAAFYAAEPA